MDTQQIASLNFYFISKLSNQPTDPVVQPDKTDKRFSDFNGLIMKKLM